MDQFNSIGVIKNFPKFDASDLSMFERKINEFKQNLDWSRNDLIKVCHEMFRILDIKKLAILRPENVVQ